MEEYFNGLLKEVDQRMATTAPGMDGKEVIGVCREMVSYLKGKNRELKEYALAHPFAGDAKEILYFKYYKPALTGRLLYYYRVYQIESGCPACLRVAEPYYRKAMERAERMMERYLPFYQYYHSGATYRDSYYFLRAKGELSPESGSFVLDEEAEFSTGYDILAARLISVEMLLVHLSRRMERAAQGTETEAVLKKNNTLDGEEVLDNQDLCLLLKVGIRTLQRYRAIGVLPYFTISGKVFYRTKDVHEFIRTRFAEVEERAAKRKEKEARKAERRRKRGLFP